MTKLKLPRVQFHPGQTAVTRDGQNVEILKIDGPGRHPVYGLYVNGEVGRWTPTGRSISGRRQAPTDLVDFELITFRRRLWLNLNEGTLGSLGSIWPTKGAADFAASPSRIACVEVEVSYAGFKLVFKR